MIVLGWQGTDGAWSLLLGTAGKKKTPVVSASAMLILLTGRRGAEERSMYGCGRRAYGRIILLL